MPKIIKNLADNQMRADVLLANAYPQYSRAALAKLFDLGTITQESIPIKAGAKIKVSGFINADVSALNKPIADIDLPVIYEDENVIVVDKPVGVISHARGRYWDEPSVASFVRGRTAAQKPRADAMQGDGEYRTELYDKYSEGEAQPTTQQSAASSGRVAGSASKQTDTMWSSGGERAGIVHRLDRATSGVMICAKNSATMSFLQKQFALRKTKKTYYAVINGTLEPPEALIDVPLGRNPKKPQTFMPDINGKPAQTKYEVTKSTGKYCLLKLTPLTGRSHQLRVHLKYLHRPIVGDELYGGQAADRLYLHAYSLEITLPGGIRKVLVSKMPPSFNGLLK